MEAYVGDYEVSPGDVQTAYDQGVAQAEAVIFFLIVAAIALIQLSATRSKEVDA